MSKLEVMRELLLRVSLFLFGFLIMFSGACDLQAQTYPGSLVEHQCPPGFKCVPEDVAASWRVIFEERMCQDAALDSWEAGQPSPNLSLTLDPYTIIVTKDGQVFSSDTVSARLVYCGLDLTLEAEPEVTVRVREESPSDLPTWGFRLRIRLALNVLPDVIWADHDRWVEPALAFEPFFYRNFHVLSWVGIDTFGAGIGMDITKNANLYGGIGARWRDPAPIPVLGVSLSFN